MPNISYQGEKYDSVYLILEGQYFLYDMGYICVRYKWYTLMNDILYDIKIENMRYM